MGIHLHRDPDCPPTKENSLSPLSPPQSTYTETQIAHPRKKIPYHPYHHPNPPTQRPRLPTHERKFRITPITTPIHLHRDPDCPPTKENSVSPLSPPQSTYTETQIAHPRKKIPYHPYHHPNPPTQRPRLPTHERKFPITPITTPIHLHRDPDCPPTKENSLSPLSPPQSTYTETQIAHPRKKIPFHP